MTKLFMLASGADPGEGAKGPWPPSLQKSAPISGSNSMNYTTFYGCKRQYLLNGWSDFDKLYLVGKLSRSPTV